MSRKTLIVFLGLLGLTILGCGTDPMIGVRYNAERDLWATNREYQNLSIRPQLVAESEWQNLATRYEGLAERYMSPNTEDEGIRREIRVISARALANAGQIHAIMGDTAAMMARYEQIETDFQDLTDIAGEIAFAKARIAEGKQDWDKAIVAYETVLERIEPDPEAQAGLGRIVVDVPLRIARLQNTSKGRESARPAYQRAQGFYRELIEEYPGTLIQIDAQSRLADIEGDFENWSQAGRELQTLEQLLIAMDEPPRDPAEIRLALAATLNRGTVGVDSVKTVLMSVVEDYPESPMFPKALIALSFNASLREELEEALGYLDRVRDECQRFEMESSQAMLIRGQLLEKNDRWPEALETFRALAVEHPISEATLLAPLEIVKHYERIEDTEGRDDALQRAEAEYRDFIERYPRGQLTLVAQEKLIQTLSLRNDYDQAIDELISLGEALAGTPQGAIFMVGAAKMAYDDLADTARAVSILDRTGEVYATIEIGQWATKEADRLRGAIAQ